MRQLSRADYELIDKVVFPIVERCGLVKDGGLSPSGYDKELKDII